jgi:hypothetical protein
MESKEYVVRVHSDRAYTYGLGEVVSDGVTLFQDGFYNLTREQLDAKLKTLPKGTVLR